MAVVRARRRLPCIMKPHLSLFTALAVALAPCAARAQIDPGRLEAVSIEWLKSAYLACDRVMRTQRVAPAIAQRCGEIGDHLRHRAFGGDFEQLLAWWQAERRLGEAVAAAADEQRISF